MRPSPTALRHACALLSTVLLSALLVTASGAPSAPPTRDLELTSGSTYLCAGYAGCRNEGYDDGGYGAVNDRSYWNMYPGHNCTNYVAYRMIQAGMSPQRPFGYPGNATNWGDHLANRVDATPSRGAVAWWRANDNGSGSAGHVAYVEHVTPDYIIISEDSWGWTFHWRKIERGSSRWPTGFIHLSDRVIENKRRPRLVGTAQVGEVLRTTNGRWNVSDARLRYRWVVGRRIIDGERDRTYTVRPSDAGKRLRAIVIARKRGWESARKYTVMTARVQPGEFTVDAAPSIFGAPVKGEQLSLEGGAFSPDPDAVDVRWFADGTRIAGATGRTLVLDEATVGARITARVRARRAAYADRTLRTEPTDAVRAGYLNVVSGPRIAGWRRVDRVLTADPGRVEPARGTRATYQWLRDGRPIAGATGERYRTTASDLGSSLGLRTTYEHPTHVTAESATTLRRTIRAGTKMEVETRVGGKRNWVVLIIDVTPRRVAVPFEGEISVRLDDRRRRFTVEDGRAIARFPDTEYGAHDAVVRQHPNDRFIASADRFRVRVERP